MVSLKMALKVDLMGQQRLVWGGRYNDPESEEYRRLEWEATHAVSPVSALLLLLLLLSSSSYLWHNYFVVILISF